MQEIETIAKDLMLKHGLHNWKFQWNNKKVSFGVCKSRPRIIELSGVLTPLRPKNETINTILHEIAHALVGTNHHHDYVWRSKFIEIGGNGRTHSSMENVDKTQIKGANWIATCANGHVHVKFKQPKSEASCGLCSRRFDRRYLLHYERLHKTA